MTFGGENAEYGAYDKSVRLAPIERRAEEISLSRSRSFYTTGLYRQRLGFVHAIIRYYGRNPSFTR